jgi:hypothetical protein
MAGLVDGNTRLWDVVELSVWFVWRRRVDSQIQVEMCGGRTGKVPAGRSR